MDNYEAREILNSLKEQTNPFSPIPCQIEEDEAISYITPSDKNYKRKKAINTRITECERLYCDNFPFNIATRVSPQEGFFVLQVRDYSNQEIIDGGKFWSKLLEFYEDETDFSETRAVSIPNSNSDGDIGIEFYFKSALWTNDLRNEKSIYFDLPAELRNENLNSARYNINLVYDGFAMFPGSKLENENEYGLIYGDLYDKDSITECPYWLRELLTNSSANRKFKIPKMTKKEVEKREMEELGAKIDTLVARHSSVKNYREREWLYQDYHQFRGKDLKDCYNEVCDYLKATVAIIDDGSNYFLTKVCLDENPNESYFKAHKTKLGFPESYLMIKMKFEGKEVNLAHVFNSIKLDHLVYGAYAFKPYSTVPEDHRDYAKNKKQYKPYRYKFLNAFDGFALQCGRNSSEQNYRENNLEVIFEHMRILSGRNEEFFEYFKKWLATIVQRPFEKVKSALVFYSREQQIGKSCFFENFFSLVIGMKYFFSTNDLAKITEKFNAISFGKLFAVLDEATDWEGNRGDNCKLKNKITQVNTLLERKGIDATPMQDYTNYVILTNNKKSVKVEEDDVRFACVQASPEKRGNASYFDKLHEAFSDIEIQKAFFHYLLNLDLTGFKPNSKECIPNTPLRNFMRGGSISNEHLFFASMNHMGHFNPRYGMKGHENHLINVDFEKMKTWDIEKKLFKEHYCKFMSENMAKWNYSEKEFKRNFGPEAPIWKCETKKMGPRTERKLCLLFDAKVICDELAKFNLLEKVEEENAE